MEVQHTKMYDIQFVSSVTNLIKLKENVKDELLLNQIDSYYKYITLGYIGRTQSNVFLHSYTIFVIFDLFNIVVRSID